MGFNFNFRQVEKSSDVRNLIDFISSQPLKYPQYDKWVQKTESQLFTGQKKGILAFSDERIVGDLVYQSHKSLARFLELKNLRVHPRLRARDFGKFMLRQVEIEEIELYDAVICDVRPERQDVVTFLSSCGYTPILEGPLYDQNMPDISFIKPLRKSKEPQVLITGKNYLERNVL